MDHKNLEYFLTTNILFHYQVKWLEFFSQFSLAICFYLGCLGFKLDIIICRENLYWKEERAAYNSVNFQNIHPVFTDLDSLYSNICSAIIQNKTL